MVCLTCLLFSQNSKKKFEGYVYDFETKQAIPNVNVFVENSSFGVITDDKGYFKFEELPFSTYNVIFQHIGYDFKSLRINNKTKNNMIINLNPRVIDMESVVVSSNKSWIKRNLIKLDRKNRLKMFTQKLLGTTENASYCEILNPDVLNFFYDDKSDIYYAKADSMVRVKNNRLGYEIHVGINDFRWRLEATNWDLKYEYYLMFKELEPKDENENMQWQLNRRNTFIGSSKHFFSLLYKDYNMGYKLFLNQGKANYSFRYANIRKNLYFSVFRGKKELIFPEFNEYQKRGKTVEKVVPIDKEDIYKDLNLFKHTDDLISIKFSTQAEYIIFVDKFKITSCLDIKSGSETGELFFDKFGNIQNGQQFIKGGVWANYGVADELPIEYK